MQNQIREHQKYMRNKTRSMYDVCICSATFPAECKYKVENDRINKS